MPSSLSSFERKHPEIETLDRRKLQSISCCSQRRTQLPFPLRSQRLRWLDWMIVATIAASSTLYCFDSCDAFIACDHRVSGLQRPYRITSWAKKFVDAAANKRRQQHQLSIFSTLPNSITLHHPHQNLQLHQSNNSNNQPSQATSSSPDTTVATTFLFSGLDRVNGDATLRSTESQEPSQTHSNHHHDYSLNNSPPSPVIHDHLTMNDKLVVAATTLVGIVGFTALVLASGPGAWRYYLSGGVCAATSHAIPTPIDVVKTRKQVDPTLRNKNFIQASTEIVHKEGFRALLAGLGPTTWGYLLEGAVKFGVYENLKPSLTRLVATLAGYSTALSFMDSQVFAFMLCGAVSGAAAAVAVCPMEALRIRMVAEANFAPQGWLHGGYKILKYEGASGLWKGMTPMLYKQVPYTVMKNVSFDLLTKLFYALIRAGGYTVTSATKFTIPFLSAMIASILSCISSQPGDMLLSLVNAHEGKRRTTDFVQDILKSEQGFRGFFVGTKTRLLHVGMIVTLQLLVYDFVKRLCGIAATGSI